MRGVNNLFYCGATKIIGRQSGQNFLSLPDQQAGDSRDQEGRQIWHRRMHEIIGMAAGEFPFMIPRALRLIFRPPRAHGKRVFAYHLVDGRYVIRVSFSHDLRLSEMLRQPAAKVKTLSYVIVLKS
jgi:hypothetical protein